MKNVWIDRIGGNSITISWKLDCAERVGTIEEYIFYYCVIVSPVDPVCKGLYQYYYFRFIYNHYMNVFMVQGL